MTEMNAYIELDGLKYATPHKDWAPIMDKPSTVRYTLGGDPDITYGPAVPQAWQGSIRVPVTVTDSTWGMYADLKASLAKLENLAFTDHYGDSYYVAALGPFAERSMSPKWDSPTNVFHIQVRLVRMS